MVTNYLLYLTKSCLITGCLSNIGHFRYVLVQELQMCPDGGAGDALAALETLVAEASVLANCLQLVPEVEYNEYAGKPLQSRPIC